MNIGEKIRVIRERKGISPERLAMLIAAEDEKSSISGGYIRKLEAGDTDNPTINTLRPIAKGLGVPISVLVDDEPITEQAINDLDIVNFFQKELPRLDNGEKALLRHSINIIRESIKEKDKYNAEKKV
jgi:transcriptional regulator with XRE-family HTH domain